MLTHERLKELLDYNPETGIFVWVENGKIAGSVYKSGYRLIKISRKRYLAHRLAWFYVHKQWPKSDIDHRDLTRDNNAILNLREATDSQNKANARKMANASTGLKGAYWHKKQRKWISSIGYNGRLIHLGSFDTQAEAHAAYCVAAPLYFGEFARLS